MKQQPEINLFDIDNFNATALKIFRYQYENNTVYQKFCKNLRTNPEQVFSIRDIPFLPIQFFKTQQVITGNDAPKGYFRSSGTTGSNISHHYYKNLDRYEASFQKGFNLAYGNIKDYCVLALLPSYLEQKHSSLIYMVKNLIDHSDNPNSGFYLYEYEALKAKLNFLELQKQKTLLLGVTFALLDLVEKFPVRLKNTIVMETGGMKGRRKEMVREELHEILCDGFGVEKIHSEYGMTELFSQAWSKGDGVFNTPPWMQILIRDVNDPLTMIEDGKTGGINVIDLANLDSCSFIATQDLGRIHQDGSFEILGRYDNSDVRGCNLLIN